VTLDDLNGILAELVPGKAAHVPYEVYEILFPPGEPDQDARLRALIFAKASGCVIENRAGNREVLFLKPGFGPGVEI
jgi:hypothetical protein